MTEFTWLHLIDLIAGLALFGNAALFIPQAIQLYRQKHARDASLLTFGGFCVLQIFVGLHGFFHHDLVLTLGMLASFIACGTVTLLIIYYRIKSRAP